MWWRIELEKSGKVAKCEPVLAPAKRGASLRFVEADTREGALEAVRDWYKRHRAQQLASRVRRDTRRRQAQLCTECGQEPPEPGKDRGPNCLAKKARYRKEWIEKGKPSRPPADPFVVRARYDALHGNTLHAPTVLKRFDLLGPKLFRDWLQALVDDMKSKAAGASSDAAE